MSKVTDIFSLYDDDEEEAAAKAAEVEKGPEAKKARMTGNGASGSQKATEEATPRILASSNKSGLLAVVGCRQGERPEMQDAHVVLDPFLDGNKEICRSAFYGVFDGHAGARAAHFCEQKMPSILRHLLNGHNSVASIEKNLKKIFTECYKSTDEQFLKEARKTRPSWKDGTTSTTLLLLNDCFYAANVGDSKAIACRYKPEEEKETAVHLTVDHNPQQFDERTRITKAGGSVKNGRVNGVIEVSRSIGDGPFKSYGVIPTPDIKKFTITQNDRFIIIGCDGLWKSFTSEAAIEFVHMKLEQARTTDERAHSVVLQWEFAADQLAAEAVKRQCGDNVSVVLIRLRDGF